MTSQTLTTALLPPALPTLDLGPATGTYTASSAFTKFAQNATVTGDTVDKILGLQVRIVTGTGSLGVVNGGTLQTTGTSGKISYTYTAGTQLLRLTDTVGDATGADFQAVLREVGIAGATGNVSISANLGKPVYSAGNGHYYNFESFVPGSTTWTAAKAAAEGSSFLGLQGYLATVTSAEENTFLTDSFDSKGWIGARADANRKWTWVGGPEKDKSFWIGDVAGSFANADIKYANWEQGAEPNNSQGAGEAYVQFTTGGVWNDLVDNPVAGNDRFSPDGYWVEYSGVGGTPTLAGTRDSITLTPPGANPQLDLVFYDPTKGQVSFAFTSNGYNIATDTPAADSPALTNNVGGTIPAFSSVWRMVSANVDVDKDGTKDIIVANTSDNSVVVFFGEVGTGGSRQFAYTRSGYVTSASGQAYRPGTDWTLDFASDKIGANDAPGLFWRSKDGVSVIWTMNQPISTTAGGVNVAISSSGVIANAGANSGWRAAGDGEFNANATTREVFWLNDISGTVVTWALTSARTLAGGKVALAGPVPTSVYRVVGIGNVNGTGNDEIVWQAGSNAIVWNMADGVYAAAGSSGAIGLTASDRIKVLADVDSDGILDLVGQNDGNGTIAAYAFTSTYALKNTSAPRTQYTSNNPAYRPAKGGTGAALELVNVAQYGA